MTVDPADKAAAKAWFDAHICDVPREAPLSSDRTWGLLEAYVELLLAEAQQQNLIAASTIPTLWTRHIVDSLQLLLHQPVGLLLTAEEIWLDLGSGAGLPAIPVALCMAAQVHMIESRSLRTEFLADVVEKLGLSGRMTIHAMPVERAQIGPVAVISARAFAPLPKLIGLANRFSGADTIWMLPKGRNAVNEVAALPKAWQDMFHVEQSCTDHDAAILVGKGHFPELSAPRKRVIRAQKSRKRRTA
jgi:16S rRNA (guanine527-N7)-methyltransferase